MNEDVYSSSVTHVKWLLVESIFMKVSECE